MHRRAELLVRHPFILVSELELLDLLAIEVDPVALDELALAGGELVAACLARGVHDGVRVIRTRKDLEPVVWLARRETTRVAVPQHTVRIERGPRLGRRRKARLRRNEVEEDDPAVKRDKRGATQIAPYLYKGQMPVCWMSVDTRLTGDRKIRFPLQLSSAGIEIDDSKGFQEVLNAFKHLNIDDEERNEIFKVLSIILHLGELAFISNDDDNNDDDNTSPSCKIENREILDIITTKLLKNET